MLGNLIFLLLSISFIEALPHKCNTKFLEKKSINLNFTEINDKRRLQNEFRPIEIHFDFSNFKSDDISISDDIIKNAKKLMNEVASEFKKFLKMRRYNFKFTKPLEDIKEFCSIKESEEIPENFFITKDIIIYPLIKQLDGNGLAESSCCVNQNDIIPRIGFIRFDPDTLLSNEGDNHLKIIIFHEMTHFLIFHPDILKSLGFLNSEGNKVNSTKALSMAKKHFNCDSLDGIPLENEGGSGSALSHWEASYMFGDYMVSDVNDDAQISDITLALFDDADFYEVEYYSGGLFKYGKNKGCDFFKKDCYYFPDEYCLNLNEKKCTNSKTAKGECLERVTFYQCPVVQGFNGDLCFQSFEPEEDNRENFNFFCLMSSLTPEGTSEDNNYQPVCYKTECDSKNKQIKIYYSDSLFIICKNSEIFENPKGFKGKIICPNYYDICDSTYLCNNLFECIDKKSKTLEESYNYNNNNQEQIDESNTSNQIFTVKRIKSSWIYCFTTTLNYVIYIEGEFSKEVNILDKVYIELTTSKGNIIKAMCTPFDKFLSSDACLTCDINICKYPLENVDLYLPLETPKQAGYIIKNWTNIVGKEPGVSNRIQGVDCIPKIKNTFIPSSIEGIGCENNYYKFKIYGNWENNDQSSLPNLLSSIELVLNNENENIVNCDYNDNGGVIYLICQFSGKGEISIKEQYFEGLLEAFLFKGIQSSLFADSCGSSDDNNISKSSFIDLNFILIILIILNFCNF